MIGVIGVLATNGACRKKAAQAKDDAPPAKPQKNPSEGAPNRLNTDMAEAGIPPRPGQVGCLNKLDEDSLPSGDIILKQACGPVTVAGETTINAKLTIEAGVTVTFVDDASLDIGYTSAGSLIAEGTIAEPIILTGKRWNGVTLGAPSSAASLHHVTFENAGVDDGSALNVQGSAHVIADCIFKGTKGYGIIAKADVESFSQELRGNSFDGGKAAMLLSPVQLPALGRNSPGKLAIEIMAGNVTKSATLSSGETYRIAGELDVNRSAPSEPLPTLTIEAGATLEFARGASLGVGYNNDGSLSAVGTVAAPIKFTGVDKTKGSWDGIHIFAGGKDVDIENAVIEFANSNDSDGAIQLRDATNTTLKAITFQHLNGVGYSKSDKATVSVDSLRVVDAKQITATPTTPISRQ